MLRHGCDPNSISTLGYNSLHYSTTSGNITQLLINAGCDVNQQGQSGATPLHFAIIKQSLEVVDILLNSKLCNLKLVDNNKFSSLQSACTWGTSSIVDMLLKAGSNIENDALFIAVSKGDLVLLNVLLDAGCCKNTVNCIGRSSLHLACMKGDDRLVAALLQVDCEKDEMDHKNMNPLLTAVDRGSRSTVEMLVEAGCNIDVKTIDDKTLLHVAVDYVHVVDYLLSLKLLDINAVDDKGDTPLHYAVLQGSIETVKLLLISNADVCMINYRDQSCLHYATISAEEYDITIVELLVKHGVNMFLLDCEGDTAVSSINECILRDNMISVHQFLSDAMREQTRSNHGFKREQLPLRDVEGNEMEEDKSEDDNI